MLGWRVPVMVAVLLATASPVSSDPITVGGVTFPGGVASFADQVVSYDPVIKSGQPAAAYRDAGRAIGQPDNSEPGINYVSLGDGGQIVLRFLDNSLTGSDSAAFDLWIFEIGPDVEDTFVAISKDGLAWSQVGKVTGGTRGVDIDAYGFHTGEYFTYVRLIDDTNEGDQSGTTVGADIDAIGAISSAAPVDTTVPEPATLLLVGSGLLAATYKRRR